MLYETWFNFHDLTLTLDVFKLVGDIVLASAIELNLNMRCIKLKFNHATKWSGSGLTLK